MQLNCGCGASAVFADTYMGSAQADKWLKYHSACISYRYIQKVLEDGYEGGTVLYRTLKLNYATEAQAQAAADLIREILDGKVRSN
jgi:hypothetical protein